MIYKKLFVFVIVQSIFISAYSHQPSAEVNKGRHPFYVGGFGGFGSSTWYGLVPSRKNSNGAIMMSTPTDAEEGGHVWGGVFGYEFIPYFAVEASYTQYADAIITFDQMSIFSFKHNGLHSFVSHTDAVSFMGKAMFFIPNTLVRVFSSAGVADVHRRDMLLDQWKLSPTFGFGVNFHLTPSLMGEVGGNYTAGYGESQLNPTQTYIPFLYSMTLRLAYCF